MAEKVATQPSHKPGIPVEQLGHMVRQQPPVNSYQRLTNQQVGELKQKARLAEPGPSISLTRAREYAQAAGFGKQWLDQKLEGGFLPSAVKAGKGWDINEQEVRALIGTSVINGELRGGQENGTAEGSEGE